MKNLLFTLTMIMVHSFIFGQTTKIEGTKLHITMPNPEWELTNTQENGDILVYYFKRTPIIDSQQRKVIPNISIIVEENDGLDVVTYSIMKRNSMPFDVTDTFIPKDIEMKYKNAIIYRGSYNDEHGKHQLYVVFVNNGKTGLRVICDVLDELFEHVEPEFLAAITSISDKKIKNKNASTINL
ncbi:MAG TPA: hypothetical protein DDY13_20375 [Cytophagales bacterium]|jgi:hypothetical protein|nr:hypothetical protein [Cytophagales bacterium]